MSRKKIKSSIRLQVKAGAANPSPPVGPALGQHGVNIMEFCKAFNADTQHFEPGIRLPVVIDIYEDRSIKFKVGTPVVPELLSRRVLGGGKGSSLPGKEKAGSISIKDLVAIARIKEPSLTAADLKAAVRTIIGTARSMGIEVEDIANLDHVENIDD